MNSAPRKNTMSKSNGKASALDALPPAIAQAVVEDAMMEAVADIAAVTATLEGGRPSVLIAETPEEEEIFDLLGVPYLGRTRVRLLAAAGIRTIDDLRAASAAEIGGIKGVGMGNAGRIKTWLATQDALPPPVSRPAPAPEARSVSPDPALAAANQAVQDDMAQIDQAITRIQQAIPARIAHKKLDRQVDKVQAVLSELAEAPDTLRPKQMRRAIKMLHLIAALLDKFSNVGHVSEKIVVAFAEELRDRRKRLQEILGPQK